MLGGCHSLPVDREAAARLEDLVPEFHEIAWANRGFHQRAARWIAEQGVGQFLDLGSGLPTIGNTHEVVREAQPAARVVYVDMDPAVADSGYALDGDDGATLIQADLRDPEALLAQPALARLIDFTEPVGLIMTGVMHFVADGSDPWGLVRRYLRPLAAGSCLALSHATADGMPPLAVQLWRDVYTGRASPAAPAGPGVRGAVLLRAAPGAALPRCPGRRDLPRPVGLRGSRAGRQRRLPLGLLRGRPPAVTVSGSSRADSAMSSDVAVSPSRGKIRCRLFSCAAASRSVIASVARTTW